MSGGLEKKFQSLGIRATPVHLDGTPRKKEKKKTTKPSTTPKVSKLTDADLAEVEPSSFEVQKNKKYDSSVKGPRTYQSIKKVSCAMKGQDCDRVLANEQTQLMKRIGAVWSYLDSKKDQSNFNTFLPYFPCCYCELEDYLRTPDRFTFQMLEDQWELCPIGLNGVGIDVNPQRFLSWNLKIQLHTAPALVHNVMEGLLDAEGMHHNQDNQTMGPPSCQSIIITPTLPLIHQPALISILQNWWPTTTCIAVAVQPRMQNETKIQEFYLPMVTFDMERSKMTMPPIMTQTVVWACLERVLRQLCFTNQHLHCNTPTTATIYPSVSHFFRLFRDYESDFWMDCLARDKDNVIINALQKIVWAFIAQSRFKESKTLSMFYKQQKECIWKQCQALFPKDKHLVDAHLATFEQPYSDAQVEERVKRALNPCLIWIELLFSVGLTPEVQDLLVLYIMQSVHKKDETIHFPLPLILRTPVCGKITPQETTSPTAWSMVHDVIMIRQHGYVLMDQRYNLRPSAFPKNARTPWIVLPSFQKAEWKAKDSLDVDDSLFHWVQTVPTLGKYFPGVIHAPKREVVQPQKGTDPDIKFLKKTRVNAWIDAKCVSIGAGNRWIDGLITCFVSRAWMRLTWARGVVPVDVVDETKMVAMKVVHKTQELDVKQALVQMKLSSKKSSAFDANAWAVDAVKTCQSGKQSYLGRIFVREAFACLWDVEHAFHSAPQTRPSYETTLPPFMYEWIVKENAPRQTPLFMRGMLVL